MRRDAAGGRGSRWVEGAEAPGGPEAGPHGRDLASQTPGGTRRPHLKRQAGGGSLAKGQLLRERGWGVDGGEESVVEHRVGQEGAGPPHDGPAIWHSRQGFCSAIAADRVLHCCPAPHATRRPRLDTLGAAPPPRSMRVNGAAAALALGGPASARARLHHAKLTQSKYITNNKSARSVSLHQHPAAGQSSWLLRRSPRRPALAGARRAARDAGPVVHAVLQRRRVEALGPRVAQHARLRVGAGLKTQ